MVRTGARASALNGILELAGYRASSAPTSPQLSSLPPSVAEELLGLYRRLGGALEAPVLRPGGWDLAFSENLVVELDEELHFNRYRAITLECSWAEDLPWTRDYRIFCEQHEDACTSAGSWGKRWTNASCERMFGGAGVPRDLSGPGAPRWKQRALYDATKDAAASVSSALRLARVSVHDRVDGVALGEILEGAGRVEPSAVRDLIEARTR